MKKYLKILIVALFVFMPFISVNAQAINISSPILLKGYLSTGGDLILTSDITLTENVEINNDTTLDLNGYTLDMSNKKITSYADFIVKDSSSEKKGTIKSTSQFTIQVGNSLNDGSFTLKSGTIECNGSYGIRNYGTITIDGGTIIGNKFPIYNQNKLTINGGEIHSKTGVVIQNHLNSTLEMNGGKVITDADYQAINLYGDCKATINDGEILAPKDDASGYAGNGISLYKNTELIINGGTITSYGSAIIGNGSGPEGGRSEGTNAKITINGGTITATNVGGAIYAPQQQGVTTINGGTLTGKTGIEIRAGKLIITGGTINADTSEYSVKPNTNGITTKGASVSVAQHTTKQPIEVIITGGKFTSSVPVSFTNPLNNSEEDIRKISIKISNGDFNATSDQTLEYTIPLNNLTGGTYTHDVTNYISEGYGQVILENGKYLVTKIHNINIDSSDREFINISKEQGLYTEKIKLNIIEHEDYNIKVEVIDEDENKIEINNNEFIMPDKDVTINVKKEYLYKIIEGANQTYNDKDLVIKTNGELNKLEKITVNGKELDSKYYTLISGSTILTLKKEYLSTLSNNTYNIKFIYNDGSVETTFKIVNNKIINPATGDNIINYIIILGLSIIGLTSSTVLIKNN